jgi:hypothetical protein
MVCEALEESIIFLLSVGGSHTSSRLKWELMCNIASNKTQFINGITYDSDDGVTTSE